MTNGKNIVALVSLAAIASAIGAYVAANGGSNAFHAKAISGDEAIVFAYDGKSMKMQLTNKVGGFVIEHGDSYSDKHFINNEGDFKITECNKSKGLGHRSNVQEMGNGYRVSFNGVSADVTVDGGVPTTVQFSGKTYTVTSFGWGAGAAFTLDGDCSAARALKVVDTARETYHPWNCRAFAAVASIFRVYKNQRPFHGRRCYRLGDYSKAGSVARFISKGFTTDFSWGCRRIRFYYNWNFVTMSGSNDGWDWILNIIGSQVWNWPLYRSGVGYTNIAYVVDFIRIQRNWNWFVYRVARYYILFGGHSLGGAIVSYAGKYYRYRRTHTNTCGIPANVWGWYSSGGWSRHSLNANRSIIGWKTGDFVHYPRVAMALMAIVLNLIVYFFPFMRWVLTKMGAGHMGIWLLKQLIMATMFRKASGTYRFNYKWTRIYWHRHGWWGHIHVGAKWIVGGSCGWCNSLIFWTSIKLHSLYILKTNYTNLCLCRHGWYRWYWFGC